MKLNKPIILLSLFSLSLTVYAKNTADDYQKWLQQENASLTEFRDARDKEFTSFLDQQWKKMEVFSGVIRDTTPKPIKMPVVKPQPIPDKPVIDVKPDIKVKPPTEIKPIPIIVKVPEIAPPKLPTPVKPKLIKKLPKGVRHRFTFFGNPLTFSTDPKFHMTYNKRIESKNISSHWAKLSKTNYQQTIKQLYQYRGPLQLNDWGYALLVNSLAKAIYPKNTNEQNLFTWFILLKSGYKARIAYNDAGIYILFPTKQKVYGAPYFVFNGIRYYSLSFDGLLQKINGVLTYDGDYPNTDTHFDMRLTQALNTKSNAKLRILSFHYNRKKYNIKISLDENIVNFFKTYPQLDIGLYFNSEVNQKIGTQLLTQLRPIINGKSEVEAVNILLRFVQKAFKYKTDGKQFGHENYLFLEETIFYPYSDCEDRAVMFAWLVRKLLKIDVVGVSYPGHIATAVNIKSAVKGDSFIHKGKRYVIADPTYINANMGQTMPDFKKYKPKAIPIKSF